MNVKKPICSVLAHFLSFYMVFGSSFANAKSHSSQVPQKDSKENPLRLQTKSADECQKLFADYDAKSFCEAVSQEKISKQYLVLSRLEQCIKDAGKLKIEALANQTSGQTLQLAQAGGYKNANKMAQNALVDVENNLKKMQEDFLYPAALSENEKTEYREKLSQVASTHDNAKEHFADCEQKAGHAERMYFQSAGLTNAAHASAQKQNLACESHFNNTKKDYFEFSSTLTKDTEASNYLRQGQISGQIKQQCATEEQAKGKKRAWILALLAIMAIVAVLVIMNKNNGKTSPARGGVKSVTTSPNNGVENTDKFDAVEESSEEVTSRSLAEESSAEPDSRTPVETAPSSPTEEEGFVEAPPETFAG